MNKERNFLTPIESIRGIAALYVALGHTIALTIFIDYGIKIQNQPHIKDFIVKFLASAFNAQTAVIVFFAISGLVIGRSLDMKNVISRANYLYFLSRRMLRIYPAHIIALICLMVMMQQFVIGHPLISSPWPNIPPYAPVINKVFAGTVFATANWHDILNNFLLKKYTFNLVTWSLYVEMAAAFFLPFLHKISREENRYVDIAMVSTLFMMTVYGHGHMSTDYLFVFYLGLLVQTQGEKVATFLTDKFRGTDRAILFFYVIMMIPAAVTFGRKPFVIFIEAIGAFSLLSLVVWGRQERVARVLSHRWFAWNGRLSYSFYLWHYIIVLFMIRVACYYIPTATWHRFEWLLFIGVGISSCALTWIIANFSYHFIEKPFMRWGKSWVKTTYQKPMAGLVTE